MKQFLNCVQRTVQKIAETLAKHSICCWRVVMLPVNTAIVVLQNLTSMKPANDCRLNKS